MSNTDRKLITVQIHNELDLDEKTLDECIIHLQALQGKYPTGKIADEYQHDGYYLGLHETRLETDEEYQNRLNRETVDKEMQKESDLEQFNRLKKKLGL